MNWDKIFGAIQSAQGATQRKMEAMGNDYRKKLK